MQQWGKKLQFSYGRLQISGREKYACVLESLILPLNYFKWGISSPKFYIRKKF